MIKPLTISIPHQLGQAEAKRRIEQGLGQLQSQIAGKGVHSLQQTWIGDVLSFSADVMGQSISGRIKVLADLVNMEIQLPGLLGMLANTIKGRLQKEGQLMLERK